MKTGALVVAAGRGARAKRADDEAPKQYVPIGGVAVLARCLVEFLKHDAIDFVLPVIHEADRAAYDSLVASLSDHLVSEIDAEEADAPAIRERMLGKLLAPVTGGASRQISVLNGLKALAAKGPETVLIHDGVRPFVSPHLISNVVSALKTDQAVVPVLPVVETVKQVEGDLVAATLDRTSLFLAQTPQGFQFDAICSAHEKAALAETISFTDDASIAEWAGMGVRVLPGDADNIKITVAADFEKGAGILAEKGDRLAPVVRVGQGFDVHAFEAGSSVTLCGVEIPFDKRLKGHSDADVGLHALTDALYGAIGAGDIGQHFPPSDPQWRGAASHIFLEHAMQLLEDKGGVVSNIDVTLICEAPKIGPHRGAMVAAIAQITGLAPERISVKATTSEKLGFTGRGEGIAAMAMATVMIPA